MEEIQALGILKALAVGNDPLTGELFRSDHVLQRGEVVRALFVAVNAVDRRIKSQKRREGQPLSALRGWSVNEEVILAESFEQGMPISDIALRLQRSIGAVVARLVKLKLADVRPIKSDDSARAAN